MAIDYCRGPLQYYGTKLCRTAFNEIETDAVQSTIRLTGSQETSRRPMSDDSRSVFDPDVLQTLSVAFDEAWDAVPNHFQYPERLRELLATQIFELAARGELDPARLSEQALARIFARRPAPPGADRRRDDAA